MEALDIIKNSDILENFGYSLLFLYSMGGGYIAIIAAGVLSAIGNFNLELSIFLAIIGNVIGSSLMFILSRTQKQHLYDMFRKHRRKLAYFQIVIKKYDIFLIFSSKYLHGIRTFVILAVGISNYNLYRFLFINMFATILWGILLGFLGFYASGVLLDFIKILIEHPYYLPFAFFMLLLFIWLLFYIKKKIKFNKLKY